MYLYVNYIAYTEWNNFVFWKPNVIWKWLWTLCCEHVNVRQSFWRCWWCYRRAALTLYRWRQNQHIHTRQVRASLLFLDKQSFTVAALSLCNARDSLVKHSWNRWLWSTCIWFGCLSSLMHRTVDDEVDVNVCYRENAPYDSPRDHYKT